MLVILNPQSNAGTALRRWQPVERALRERHPDMSVELPADADQAVKLVQAHLERSDGTTPEAIVAAGGDGMVNLVLNAIMDTETDRPRPGAEEIALGAIGLGSSNDFHKPVPPSATIAGVAVRVDAARAEAVDVGKATMLLPDGTRAVRYFLLNASMGLVAAGNDSFNNATGALAWLKSRNVEAAIVATALRNIATHRPLRLEVRGTDWSHTAPITNIGVLKSVHFAGGMYYDTPVTRTDGRFDVNIWAAAGRLRVLGLIAGLYRGAFTGSPLAICRRDTTVELRPERPVPLELDGEITVVESARLEVLPRVLKVCAA
ncbi:Diacylglycerol kinase family enzyme [Nocardia amikacinitolerans]|uniref:diacylglycerol/lipid kinase family protein n=1 Tax=Nocardia amikacinitolerans TaxID=756689 RepID=UPI0020A43F25|nr:diacylglycerol kinase family protein [Nocardia amikacinitolerans]MCP2294180.1 Diacylglycerol kinase family enzyme [Nocardia amikacinitolerans]